MGSHSEKPPGKLSGLGANHKEQEHTRRKKTHDKHTRDIPEKDLFPGSAESEAFDCFIRS